ncbi:MAG: trypsin-like serine protease, partial [Deltaproteobacteria bacterium]|nr:trypsin-like serine protease [Deltaproteobacteria bacterium]
MIKPRLGWLLVSSLFGAVGCGPGELAEGPTDELGALESPIVGGSIVKAGDDAVVALSFEGEPFCTGTLIGKRTVLTAAH